MTTQQEQLVAPKRTAKPAAGEDRSRTLGIIIPLDGKYSRFIKFSGAIDAIEQYENEFNSLVASITDIGTEDVMPKYTLPKNWKENPARQFVNKSLNVGAPNTPDVTISNPIGGTLIDNVNRWFTEVGAKEVTEAELPKVIQEIIIGGKKAYRVDVRGPKLIDKASMRGPFMGGKN